MDIKMAIIIEGRKDTWYYHQVGKKLYLGKKFTINDEVWFDVVDSNGYPKNLCIKAEDIYILEEVIK